MKKGVWKAIPGSAVLRFFMGGGAFIGAVSLRFCQGRQARDGCTMLSAKEETMARESKLDRCDACGHEARVGVYLGYYSVKSKHKRGVSKQTKGTLPALGYCVNCFLKLAKKEGMSREKLEELREELAAAFD